jgi:uncharacterized protein with GYD domain
LKVKNSIRPGERVYNAFGGTRRQYGRTKMPKYLVEACYTSEGVKNLHKDRAEGRTAAIKAAMQSLGGKLEAIYWSLGEYDAIVLCELPDAASAAAISLAVAASGLVRTKTTQLLTADEIDSALAKAVKYRAPGQ